MSESQTQTQTPAIRIQVLRKIVRQDGVLRGLFQGFLNTTFLGPYSRTLPSVVWWFWGEELFLMSETQTQTQTPERDPNPNPNPRNSPNQVLRRIVRQDGVVRGLYRGFLPGALRSFVSNGATNPEPFLCFKNPELDLLFALQILNPKP